MTAGRGHGHERVLLEMTPQPSTVDALVDCLERRVPVVLVDPRAPAPHREQLAALRVPDGCQVVVSTSGTTGAPRPVFLTRDNLIAAAHASEGNLGWRHDDRWLVPLPLAHVGGLMVLVRCWLAGRVDAAVLVPERPGEPEVLAAALDHGATLASLVPTQLHRLVEAGVRAPRSLRAVLVGGAAAHDALLSRAVALGWPVLPSYGSTETCAYVVSWPYGVPWAPGRGVGRPLAGVDVRVVDDELVVRGPMVAGGVHRTSDLGAIDADGFVHVLGRRDDVVITGGENVAPAQVVTALLGAPGVRDAAVFAVDDADLGQRLAAVLVVDGGFAWATLDQHVAALLPRFARPRAWALTPAITPPDGKKPGSLWLREQFSAQLMARPGVLPEREHREKKL